jgi:membrane protein DedA with SNARE-associated domain
VSTSPDPAAPPRDEFVAAVAGTILWAVALVVLAVFFRSDLQRHDASWWLWTCALGVLMGLYGIRYALRRRRRS